MPKDVQLITYVDRIAGDLQGLRSILDNELRGLFGGVHILPFFDPIDGSDAGFDPIDHTRVDPRLGGWKDVAALTPTYRVMADLIVNHLSSSSPQFEDVKRHGSNSPYWDLFLKKSDLFSDDPGNATVSEEIRRIYRPRPGPPFTNAVLDDGSQHEFWTTFSPQQMDINVESVAGKEYLDSILARFSEAGVGEIRLDAAGYAIKRRGTSCFMLPETFDFIATLSERARQLGMSSLVEIHSHYQTQVAIASQVGRVYDFALPPLVLHTLYTGSTSALKGWLHIAPRNCVTVLDTHDGIGILDVACQGKMEGLLQNQEIDSLVETIHRKTNGASRRASGHAASNLDVYQINSTYYDALGRNDLDYLIARAIQFFAPGIPQVYYVGLLAGHNDLALVEKTDVGRDTNRHYYSRREVCEALRRPVVRCLTDLISFRNSCGAFSGIFSMPDCADDELVMRWDAETQRAELRIELSTRRGIIQTTGGDGPQRICIDDDLLT